METKKRPPFERVRPYEHMEVPILKDGYYRTTYPDGQETIQFIKDNHNDVGDTLEKEVKFFGATYQRVYLVTSPETIRVAMECIASEKSALENLMDGWKETSPVYKRHEIEVLEYQAAYEELSKLLEKQ